MVEADKTFRDFANALPALIGIFRDSRGILFNRFAEQITGRDSGQLTGREFIEFVWPADRQQVQRALTTISAGSRSSWRQEFRLQGQSDQPSRIDFSLTAFQFEGQPCVLGIGLVVTQRQDDESQLQDQQRAEQRVARIRDFERELISYDLHDGLLQTVIGAQLTLESIVEQLRTRCPEAHSQLETLRQSLQSALDEGRRLIRDVRPMMLEETNIVDAIQHLINELASVGGPSISFQCHALKVDLSPVLAGSLYRIVQEALRNVQRHAQVERAVVRLNESPGSVSVEIEDQGVGFETQQTPPPGHYGLEGIRERARLFGGRAVVRSSPGHGTLISVELPLELPDSRGDDGRAGL